MGKFLAHVLQFVLLSAWIFIIAFALVMTLSGTRAKAAMIVQRQPPMVYQPRGYYVLYHRPTLIGEALFGPLWVFIPSEPQPLPAPQPNPAPTQNPANQGPALFPAR